MQELPPTSETKPEAPAMPGMSLAARLANVFVSPGEVFEQVKNAPACTANWLAPALLVVFVGWVGGMLVFSQPSIQQQASDVASKGIEQQIEKMHMSESDAERTRQMGEKWTGITQKIGMLAVPVFSGFVTPFFWGLIVWLVGTYALKGSFTYMKAVEVAGVGNMVLVLASIVGTLLILTTNNLFATPSPALLLKDTDPQKPAYALLALVNAMSFWALGIRSSGLARLAGASFAKAAAWVFGIWIAYTGALTGVGLGARALFSRRSLMSALRRETKWAQACLNS
jgi:hypothetical protein